MLSFEDAIQYLKSYLQDLDELERNRINTLNSPLPQGLKDERDVRFKQQIESTRTRILEILNDLTLFPPRHDRHYALLQHFHQTAPFDKSVFIMTKFHDPQSNDPRNVRLGQVIQAVQDAIQACRHTPRIATENNYHMSLWDNVELHLLGCSRGVAIVEDKHSQELNPNVAMEWGWMVGMGRRVLYLVEQDFQHARADWGGLIKEEFDWNGPFDDIKQAVHKFLCCKEQH